MRWAGGARRMDEHMDEGVRTYQPHGCEKPKRWRKGSCRKVRRRA